MTPKQTEQTSDSAINFTLNGQFKNALDATRLLADELQWGDINDRLSDLQENYNLMLQYFMQGADDPERNTILKKSRAKLLQLNILLREELFMRNFTSFEYTQKRYFPHKLHFGNINDLMDSLRYYHSKKKLAETEISPLHENELKRLRINFERLLPDLFMIYWLTTSLDNNSKATFRTILSPEYDGVTEKCLVVSALTLNLWRMFDEEKLILLLEACEHDDSMVRQRALTGLCFILARYNSYISFYPSVHNRLLLLADNKRLLDNLKNILLLIAGTADTDRITRKMKEEILPEMIKISPMIKNKLESEALSKPDDWSEENPEWSEMLEQSGLGEKLQELTNLQLEGADVYMSTFSVLKNFPFFNETANWFLPFDPEISHISELFSDKDKSLLSAFLNNSIICNSDKYSFSLSVMQMPLAQRDMMSRSFRTEADQMAEITRDENLLKPDLADKNIARQYIQDLFRFFRLHPQHGEFSDMFDYALQLHKSAFFDVLAEAGDLKEQLAEFYFTKSFYLQAIELYRELSSAPNPSAALFQKTGFALQKLNRIEEALSAYLKADIIMPDDVWTVRKIALCYRITGQYDKALEFYRHIEFLKPGLFSTQMQIGKCLVFMGKYKEALQHYAVLEEKYPDELKLWRAIGWCAFIAGNLHQADYYFEKVVSSAPDSVDLLNAGHIALCLKKRSVALSFYQQSLNMQQASPEILFRQLEADKTYLINNGIDASELQLIRDALSYSNT